MRDQTKFYIGGRWVDPVQPRMLEVVNPATETVAGRISLGSAVDVERAVAAAREAFPTWSRTTRGERVAALERIATEYERRLDDVAHAITEEMGAPAALAHGMQSRVGLIHLTTAAAVLRTYPFEEDRGATRIVKEPIGVCALITPWNWPINQMAAKVCPALATGCTIVLKPSEIAPFSAMIWAEVLHAADLPPGVFNLVNGDGETVGGALSAHPGVDMVSFTGSTRAGVQVAKAAAPTVKRVAQELGGKSPFILLDDADFGAAAPACILRLMSNSGQSCNAPSRLLVPATRMDEVVALAKRTAVGLTVGDPDSGAMLGPVVSLGQWDRIQSYIRAGLSEGATLVAGGLGRPEGLDRGYYVKPTIFAHVTRDMRIAREEIFGPVLSILAYDDVEDAIALGNDTDYGLAAYVCGADLTRVREVASRLRAGHVGINGGAHDVMAPFGGYKMSGNGREWGDYAFAEYLEVKAMVGFTPQ